MRVLVTGDFAFPIYEPAFCAALRSAGAEVLELPAGRFFGRPGSPWRRAQTKYVVGPGVLAANAALVATCAAYRPDVVLAWRTPWLRRAAIVAARAAGARAVVLSNNDDPFGPDRELRIWRAYRRLVPVADACFVYRDVNVHDHRAAGARGVHLLRSWYDPAVHRPLALTEAERARFACDVVFVGHCEDDERLDAIDALLESGLHVRLFGTLWERFARGRRFASLLPVQPVLGDDYARALAGAKVALVFLSRRNRDQYTRRCFEIPAVGTAMLAPRTAELQRLFREDEEAAFFDDVPELVRRARALVADDALRERIARGGRERVRIDGHDVVSRARGFLHDVEALLTARAGGGTAAVVGASPMRGAPAMPGPTSDAAGGPRWRDLLRRGLERVLER